MSSLAPDIIALLRYLLPGFLAAWVFLGLTGHEKDSQFERIVQALIFTLFVQGTLALGRLTGIIGTTDVADLTVGSSSDLWSVVAALFVGVLFAVLGNTNALHAVLRRIGVTQQTAYPSEWFGVLKKSGRQYVVLHLHDGRRLSGWAQEWPQSSERGHFYIVRGAWLLDPGNESDSVQEQPLDDNGVEGLLLSVEDVRWVEFLKEKHDGQAS